jgi:hypothetical protein
MNDLNEGRAVFAAHHNRQKVVERQRKTSEKQKTAAESLASEKSL